ncbi:hypothetical protein [Candidatus Nesciobacter abundans]|uniref:Uncharacterized protein n=1 Tax=Candidatus Nesciobacter abundans TaxID=2601668 RepID=A0A5C0UH18_9PROT|nr:hypothetical protein [Candidatus Nesciobacter abundans]QEK38961.1 hypothetical protein FZC36_00720 [Candidatus Nesciobacter abundans]
MKKNYTNSILRVSAFTAMIALAIAHYKKSKTIIKLEKTKQELFIMKRHLKNQKAKFAELTNPGRLNLIISSHTNLVPTKVKDFLHNKEQEFA